MNDSLDNNIVNIHKYLINDYWCNSYIYESKNKIEIEIENKKT